MKTKQFHESVQHQAKARLVLTKMSRDKTYLKACYGFEQCQCPA